MRKELKRRKQKLRRHLSASSGGDAAGIRGGLNAAYERNRLERSLPDDRWPFYACSVGDGDSQDTAGKYNSSHHPAAKSQQWHQLPSNRRRHERERTLEERLPMGSNSLDRESSSVPSSAGRVGPNRAEWSSRGGDGERMEEEVRQNSISAFFPVGKMSHR